MTEVVSVIQLVSLFLLLLLFRQTCTRAAALMTSIIIAAAHGGTTITNSRVVPLNPILDSCDPDSPAATFVPINEIVYNWPFVAFIHDIHNVRWDSFHFLIGMDSLKSVNFFLTIRFLRSCISICQATKLLPKYPKELHFIHDMHNVRWDSFHFLIGIDSFKSVNFFLTIRLLRSCINICQAMKLLP